jgi:hypothetical protein
MAIEDLLKANIRIVELEAHLAEAQKASEALRLLAVQYPVAVEQAVNIVKATLNAPRTDCPACMMGQDASKGEGTHLEGTRQHPQEPA